MKHGFELDFTISNSKARLKNPIYFFVLLPCSGRCSFLFQKLPKKSTKTPRQPKGVDAFLEILNSHEASRKAPLTNAKGAFSWSLAEYAIGGRCCWGGVARLESHFRWAQNELDLWGNHSKLGCFRFISLVS